MTQSANTWQQYFGYQSEEYTKSFQEWGKPIKLDSSQGWIIQRKVPEKSLYDVMGCYPFMVCSDWEKIEEDLSRLENSLVSLTLVTDPAGIYHQELLRSVFPDLCQVFKEHFVVDLQTGWKQEISNNHKRNAKKAAKNVEIEHIDDPHKYLDTWCCLYDKLIERHNINGMTAFSRTAFDLQLKAPGIGAHRAVYKGQTVGMVLWYLHEQHVYYHLGAYSDTGYEEKASFAIFMQAMQEFAAQGKKRVYLGAGAGLNLQADDGLTRFKRGWANSTRTVYLCGRILDRPNYAALVQEFGLQQNSYFPAYRSPEFGG
jgi:hypothetical protein